VAKVTFAQERPLSGGRATQANRRNTKEDDYFVKGEDLVDQQSEKGDFIERPGSVTNGRLIFTSDTSGITILADPWSREPARGDRTYQLPRVQDEEGALTIQYRDYSLPNGLIKSHVPLGELKLSTSIPWEIEFRGNVSNVSADLRGLTLRSLDLLGGASQSRLLLSKPTKTTFLYITGGIQSSRIRVLPSVGIRVHISGGITHLVFDGQRFDAINGDRDLENSNFKSMTSRYDICIAGGANHVLIGE
jgi:hypothetical protein